MTLIKRHKTLSVAIGDVHLGGGAAIVVQSMTNTDTDRFVEFACGFDHIAELDIALFTVTDVAGVDSILGQRPGTGLVLVEQLMAIEVEIADHWHIIILGL